MPKIERKRSDKQWPAKYGDKKKAAGQTTSNVRNKDSGSKWGDKKKAAGQTTSNVRKRDSGSKWGDKQDFTKKGEKDGFKRNNDKKDSTSSRWPKKEKPAEVEVEVVAISDVKEDFDYESSDSDDGIDREKSVKKDIQRKIQAANRKGSKSGGFQSMGLSPNVFKAIQYKGYKIPTPIQRKSIPIINDGRDIVAMARTGSGKTAAFLIPMIEKLKTHSAKVGARAVVLSPSRELALQTLKFTKELSKYTDLRSCMLVGGESMEEHFNYLAANPDIIIATPGRLMHLIIEMSLSLITVEYIVFDEADRLYELGFAEHLREILHKLPETRQTLLFSATLPKTLVEFARAGLTDPALIRLDMDTKISKDLQMVYLSVKAEEKDAALLYCLANLTEMSDQLTMIFAPTKHHVDYLFELLKAAGIKSTYIYGTLDQSARKIHLARFRAGRVKIMITTDVAARGIDIPLLDYVINWEFPGHPKVFVHRVGRVARAGRSGTAISFVSTDELPFLIDLQLFLGRPLVLGAVFENNPTPPDFASEIVFGTIPPAIVGVEQEKVVAIRYDNATVSTFLDSSRNAFKLYSKTRPTASKESYVRAKEITGAYIGMHPMIVAKTGQSEVDRQVLLRSISQFRPAETVFEVGRRGGKSTEAIMMGKRRTDLQNVIIAAKSTKADLESDMIKRQVGAVNNRAGIQPVGEAFVEQADEDDIQRAFPNAKKMKRKRSDNEDSDYYMSHTQKGAATEVGYSMQTKPVTFAEQIKVAAMDLNGDDEASMLKTKAGLIWDKKSHKFVRPTVGADNKKMIRTESGALIAASYKSDRYEEWQKKKRTSMPQVGDMELADAASYGAAYSAGGRRYRHNSTTAPTLNSASSIRKAFKRTKEGAEAASTSASSGRSDGLVKIKRSGKDKMVRHKTVGDKARSELKTGHQIVRERKEKDMRRAKTGRHQK